MSISNLYYNVNVGGNIIDVLSLETNEGYKQTTARCSIETNSVTGVGLNDTVAITIGYEEDHAILFRGYVDDISESRLPGTYEIACRDVLKLAIEHFIVSTDLENPWSRENIVAENLVRDILLEASISNYSGEVTAFTFGTSCPAEFNLMSSWDGINLICNILAYHCYAEDGTVYFKRIFPVPAAVAEKTFTVGDTGEISYIEYGYNTDNLRNKVVVFGRDGIYAEASVVSPYLPAGFYKTAIVSSDLIDQQSMADAAAQYNLELYNKLTEYAKLSIIGDHTMRCRDTIAVTEPFTEMVAKKWFVYAVTHKIMDNKYTTELNLSR